MGKVPAVFRRAGGQVVDNGHVFARAVFGDYSGHRVHTAAVRFDGHGGFVALVVPKEIVVDVGHRVFP